MKAMYSLSVSRYLVHGLQIEVSEYSQRFFKKRENKGCLQAILLDSSFHKYLLIKMDLPENAP